MAISNIRFQDLWRCSFLQDYLHLDISKTTAVQRKRLCNEYVNAYYKVLDAMSDSHSAVYKRYMEHDNFDASSEIAGLCKEKAKCLKQ